MLHLSQRRSVEEEIIYDICWTDCARQAVGSGEPPGKDTSHDVGSGEPPDMKMYVHDYEDVCTILLRIHLHDPCFVRLHDIPFYRDLHCFSHMLTFV